MLLLKNPQLSVWRCDSFQMPAPISSVIHCEAYSSSPRQLYHCCTVQWRLHSIFSVCSRLLLKIAAAPVVAILALLVWFCTWLVYVSGAVLGLVSLLLCVCSVLLFLSSSVTGGIIYLVLAFLASPFGLPTVALWLLDRIQGLRYWIQESVYD